MSENVKSLVNKALGFLKMILVANNCGIATDHEGHIFIFDNGEYKRKGSLEKCSGIVVALKDLVG